MVSMAQKSYLVHPSYRDYVDKFVPPPNRPLLESVLDQGDDTERHLLEIAHYITDWEVKLVGPLGLTREEVEGIKGRTSDPELRRREVLKVWKDKEGLNATYKWLLDKCLQGKDSRTAQKICEVLAQADPPSAVRRSIGRQDSVVSVKVMRENLAKIKGSFATLVTNITTNLMKKNINMGELRLYITTLFPPGDFIAYAKSVADVCEAMSHHQLWDFHSFTPVEEIVKKFGENDPQLTGWIRDYKSELAGFKAVTRIADYIEACSDDEDIADAEQSIMQNIARYDKRYHRKLSIKLKARITEKSLDYIDQFWRSIADYFLLPSLPVLLDTIKEGCVEVTWLVPTVPALQIEANMEDYKEIWRNLESPPVEKDGVILYYAPQTNMEDFWKSLGVTRVEMDRVVLYETESDVGMTDNEEYKAPLGACTSGKTDHEVSQLLLDHGALVDLPRPHMLGPTPLIAASACGKLKVVQFLLQQGAEVDAQHDDDGSTALFQSCEGGHLDVAKTLVAHGASINIPLKNGATALMVASQKGYSETVKFLLQMEAESGLTALMCATYANHPAIVAELLAHGADTELAIAEHKSGLTPLIIATKNNYPEVVELLLEAKAQVDNRERSSGRNALMIAASQGNMPILKLLIKYGSDLSLKSEGSEVTAYDIASIAGHFEACEELQKHGYRGFVPHTEGMRWEVQHTKSVLSQDYLDIDNQEFFYYRCKYHEASQVLW